MRTVKAQARLRGCAGSPEPSLVACDKYYNLMSWLICLFEGYVLTIIIIIYIYNKRGFITKNEIFFFSILWKNIMQLSGTKVMTLSFDHSDHLIFGENTDAMSQTRILSHVIYLL